MTLLEVRGLRVGYGSREVICSLSFRLESGSVMGILGANGCGKTTLLKALCGILPSQGQRILCGEELQRMPPRRLAQLCRYIPQKSGIEIDISTLDVVLMGFNPQLGLLEYPSAAMRQRAAQALAQVGLEDRAEVNYQSLSEGQKQMCILARTLVSDGRLLFLDEPESALDFGGRYRMLAQIRDWTRQAERGSIVTLHDPQLALNCCDTLLLLKNGQKAGQIDPHSDTPEQMERALTAIYGSLSVVPCRNRAGETQLVLLKEA